MPGFPKDAPIPHCDPNDPMLRRLRSATAQIMALNPAARFGAWGTGIGPRIRGERYSAEICLRFYVERKRSPDTLEQDRRIPSELTFSDTGDGSFSVKTDVIECAKPRLANADPESVVRPVPGGVSISVPGTGGNGTLGAWVLDRTDDTVVALSNRHVLGGSVGASVIQPGAVDGGNPATDRIGTVKRFVDFVPVPRDREATPDDCMFVDAGIIGADDPDLISLTVLGLGAGVYTTDTAEIGDPVQKSGQTTGYTTGVVVEVDMMNYDFPQPITPGNFEPVVICDNILVQASPGTPPPGILSDGDSGSVLFGFNTAEGATIHPAVGLAWAQADGNLVACKIQHVFSELNLDVLCASGFPAYLDGLAAEDEADLTAGVNFVGAARTRRSAALPSAGLARSVEARLLTGKHGKRLVQLVGKHRHELTQQMIRQCDLRRAATRALVPILRGARISDDVLKYRLSRDDVYRIKDFLRAAKRAGLREFVDGFDALPLARKKSVGKRVGRLLGVSGDAPDCA